ncbi:MAG: protein kinase domain-containing protein [Myxococcaceae bacterium]
MSTPNASSNLSGRYRILSKLASGGMAEVYRAVLSGPEGFEKPSVVKRMLPELARQERYRQMFVDEARLMASLNHRNVVGVLDFGLQPDGSYFIALEYVDGVDLAKALRAHQKLPPALAVHIVESVLDGLGYVHGRRSASGEPLSIVHRDVSPQNVLLGRDGDVKLGDFGIAKGLASAERTSPGTIKGKLAYMSPEQANAAPLDGRSDLFSAGVVLYEALLGRRPFEGESEIALWKVVAEARVPDPLFLDPSLDPALAAVLRKALSREPAQRYANAEEMALALLGCAHDGAAGPAEVGRLVVETLAAQQAGDIASGLVDPRDVIEEPFGAALLESRGAGEPPRGPTTAVERPAPARRGSPEAETRPLRPPTAKGRGSRWVLAGLAVAAVIMGGAGGAWLLRERSPAERPRPTAAAGAPGPAAEPAPVPPTPVRSNPPEPTLEPPARAGSAKAPGHRAGPRPAARTETPLEPARIDVNSTPWANVSVDGVPRGSTPLYALALAPGRHVLHLANPLSKQAVTMTVDLKPGEVRVIPVNLEGSGRPR